MPNADDDDGEIVVEVEEWVAEPARVLQSTRLHHLGVDASTKQVDTDASRAHPVEAEGERCLPMGSILGLAMRTD